MSRKRASADAEGGSDFIVLFTALSVILLAFFILLNSLAVMDQQRKRMAFGSLVGGFGILSGGLQFDREGNLLLPGTPMLDKEGSQISAIAHLKKYLVRHRLEGQVEVYEFETTYRVVFRNKLFFAPGGTLINPRLFPVLDEIGSLIARLNSPVRLEGHADDRAPGGNWRVSLERAVAAREYLVRAAGVPGNLLVAVGRAHYHPRVEGDDEAAYQQNRRLEFVLDRAVWQ